MNDYKNVILEQKAVCNKNGNIKLYLCEENNADNRIYDSQDFRKSININSVRLDDYFKDYNGRIDFIKMDIQGAEAGAFKGMSSILEKNENIMVIAEFWPFGLVKSGNEPAIYLDLLLKHNFKLYNIDEISKKFSPLNNINEFLKTYTVKRDNYTNLVCTRNVLPDFQF